MAGPDAAARVHAALIQTQYRQARNNIISENVCLILVAVSAAFHTDWRIVAAWAAAEVATQVYRTVFMLRPYASGWPKRDFANYWARHHAIYQTSIGFIWGGSMFLFAHQADPISVLMTLSALVIIVSGAVPGLAYNLPAMYGFISVIFALASIRLALFSGLDYRILAVASVGYAVVLALMGRLQADTVAEAMRIRFENVELLDALTVRTEEADAARRAAEASNLAKSQFLAAASHDLRQPLYALSLFSESLQSLKLDDEAERIVASIQGNIGAMEVLFNGLLDISRLEAGAITVTRQPVSLDALFQRIEQMFGAVADEHGLALRLRSNGEWVMSDLALLEQVVTNLVANALRHTVAGGVLVAARGRPGAVRIEVWDTGIGIAAADRARVFDDFVQLGNPERDRRKGLGLGLAIVRRAAELLGSSVELASVPGRGSVFRINQPACAAAAPTSAPIALEGDDIARSLRLLVVDDDPDVRSALATVLGQWGIAADIVADDADALARIARGAPYDVLLTDQRLAGSATGLDLIARVRALGGAGPAVALITGDMDAALIAAAREAGVPILHKPVQRQRLRALLNHLGGSRRRADGAGVMPL